MIQGVLYGSVGFGCGLIGQGIANMIMTAKRYSSKFLFFNELTFIIYSQFIVMMAPKVHGCWFSLTKTHYFENICLETEKLKKNGSSFPSVLVSSTKLIGLISKITFRLPAANYWNILATDYFFYLHEIITVVN